MAKRRNTVAKKATKASVPSSSDLDSKLEELQKKAAESQAKLQAEAKKLMKSAIDAKKEEIRAVKAESKELDKKLKKVENELFALQVKSGEKRANKKRGKSSGRKPRTSVAAKKKVVADELANHNRAMPYAAFRAVLLDKINPENGHPFFSTPDFASSKVFAKKYLPKGWKVQGERRDAEIAPTK